jgi:hypothetical protein
MILYHCDNLISHGIKIVEALFGCYLTCVLLLPLALCTKCMIDIDYALICIKMLCDLKCRL